MTSISEKYSDSGDDSDYEPDVELFSEDKTVILNQEEKSEAKSKTRNGQNLLETTLYFECKLKEVKKSDLNLVEAKNQADSVYKSFLEEAAAEMKLLKNECFSSDTDFSEVNTGSFIDTRCNKESCCSLNMNANISDEGNETAKNISSLNYKIKSDLSTSSVSKLEKNSMTSPLSTMKKRNLRSVMENVLKKRKKETILSTSMKDWQKFKEEEDIADELKTYNQGKKGYLERKRFLERSDLCRFKIEREMRLSKKQTSPDMLSILPDMFDCILMN